jgi:hypothetical protein
MERIDERVMDESLELNMEAKALYVEIVKKPEVFEALNLLDKLPGHLRYHNKAHTEDVILEAILFALADGASMEVIEQQAVTAAWHDVGFIKQDRENEIIAVNLFEQSEAYKTLSDEDRVEVISNIMDTQVVIKNDLPFLAYEKSRIRYALDADVSNFGRDDFFEKRAMVAEELGLDLTDMEVKKKFCWFVLNLLKNHEWQTASARSLRQAQKEENIRLAEEEYARL